MADKVEGRPVTLIIDDSLEASDETTSTSISPSPSPHKSSFMAPIRLAKRSVLPGNAVRDSPKSPVLPQTPGKTPLEDFNKYFAEVDIAFEYKLLHVNILDGVFILPSDKGIREWHGVIFVHSGPYRAGIFKFTIYLTDGFPKSRPIIKFISHVTHPLIHPKTGIFNFSREFPSWTPYQDHVWNILHFMKRSFYDNTTWLSEEEEDNVEDYETNDYKRKIQSSVQDSLTQVYHPRSDDQEHSIVFPAGDDAKYIEAKKLIMSGRRPQLAKEEGESSFFQIIQSRVVGLLDKMVV